MRPAIERKPVKGSPDMRGGKFVETYYRWNGEPARPPKKGECYLSGAIVMAWRAPNDLATAYYIAERVPPEEVPCSQCHRPMGKHAST